MSRSLLVAGKIARWFCFTIGKARTRSSIAHRSVGARPNRPQMGGYFLLVSCRSIRDMGRGDTVGKQAFRPIDLSPVAGGSRVHKLGG
jgi:hypothetical protein